MNDASSQRPKRSWLYSLINAVVCLAILAASAAAVAVINRTEPTAEQINATRRSKALVETVTVTRGEHAPQIVVLGTVQPAQDIVLSPRVRGQVAEVSPEFVPGGMVSTGDLLVRIDPADLENTVLIRQSELAQVKASLEIENGRQVLAKKELALLGDTIEETDLALVLREPQLASIKAQVSAAEAALQRAEFDLDRTQVVAPFDAQVLSRSTNVGSQVTSADELGRLIGVDEYWVIAAVPVRSLRWIQFPSQGESGSRVALRNADAWGADAERHANVTRMIGALDQQTRLARVLISVADPLGINSAAPALILDTLMEVRIECRAIPDVVRLKRNYVRDGGTVWVMKDETLEIREVDIVFQDAEFAYLRRGLESGDEVVTTTLATVANGVGLRKVSGTDQPDARTEGAD